MKSDHNATKIKNKNEDILKLSGKSFQHEAAFSPQTNQHHRVVVKSSTQLPLSLHSGWGLKLCKQK